MAHWDKIFVFEPDLTQFFIEPNQGTRLGDGHSWSDPTQSIYIIILYMRLLQKWPPISLYLQREAGDP